MSEQREKLIAEFNGILDACGTCEAEDFADAALAVISSALAEARAAERERCAKVVETLYPVGSAHTYASENADTYIAQEATCQRIAERIRALCDPDLGQ